MKTTGSGNLLLICRFPIFLFFLFSPIYSSDAIYLKTRAFIKTQEVMLSSIARLPDNVTDIPIFPTPGSPVKLSPSEVQKLLPKELSDRKVFGSDCYLVPLNKVFSKEEIEESFFRELVLHYNKNPENIRVKYLGEEVYFPDRGVELKWGNFPRHLQPGQKIFTLDAWRDEKRIYSVHTKFLLEEKFSTPVATRKIQRFEILKKGDIELKETFHSESVSDFYSGPLVGITALSVLEEGDIIKKRHVREIHTVEKGTQVELFFSEGNLLVVSKGTARESGNLGQKIKVQTKSGSSLSGTITGDGKVLVE